MPLFYNPIQCDPKEFSIDMRNELFYLQSDPNLLYLNEKGISFWKNVDRTKYPLVFNEVLKICSMFGSSYLCEQGFSLMKYIKNKHRSNLTNEHLEQLMRISTTKFNIQNYAEVIDGSEDDDKMDKDEEN